MSVDHRLARLAMDLRALHDALRLKAQWAHAAECKRVATELEHCRVDMLQADSAADTGVLSLDDPAIKREPPP